MNETKTPSALSAGKKNAVAHWATAYLFFVFLGEQLQFFYGIGEKNVKNLQLLTNFF